MTATLQQLRATNYHYTANKDRWKLLQAMTDGGMAMDADNKRQLLVNADNAHKNTFDCRLKLAPYDCSIGSIVIKLVSQLMHTKMVPTGSGDKFYDDFFKSCTQLPHQDNKAQSFKALLSNAATIALSQGKAIAQIDTRAATAVNRIDQQDKGTNVPRIILRNCWDLMDWDDSGGEYSFAKICTYKSARPAWDLDVEKQYEFTIYQTVGSEIYASSYIVVVKDPESTTPLELLEDRDVIIKSKLDDNGRPIEDIQLFHTNSGDYQFPIVSLSFPPQLHLADRLFDTQKSFFNQNTSLEWSLLQTNYALLVYSGVESPYSGDNVSAKQKVGDGRYLELEPDRTLTWLEKEGKGNALTMEYMDRLKAQMAEIVSVIAQSATLNSQKYQSAESKKEDRRPLDILLDTYGAEVKRFGEQVLNVCSIARGEKIDWKIDGFCDYNSADLDDALAAFNGLTNSGINSNTFIKQCQRALIKKAAEVFEFDAATMATIESELSDEPFNLDDSQRQALIDAANAQSLHPYDLLMTLKASGNFPSNFDVDEAVARLQIDSSNGNAIEIADKTGQIIEPIPEDLEKSGDLSGELSGDLSNELD